MNLITFPFANKEFLNNILNEINKYQLNSSGEFVVKNIQHLEFSNINDFNSKIVNIFNSINKPIFLFENHSLTLQILNNLKKIKNNFGIIIFDAHPDCDFKNEFDFFGKQKDLLISLIDERIIEPKNIIIVGLRKWTKDEYYLLKNYNIRYFDIKKIDEIGLHELADILMENALQFENLYVSVDLDVLDPGFVSVQCPEPNGLTSRELFYLLNRLKKMKNLTAMDVSEIKDDDEKTIKIVAKLISEIS